jgi:phosphoglycerol transferase MdoB-like AlkP superfamily enzyme
MCRLVFVAEHWGLIAVNGGDALWRMCEGSLVFDTSALLYLLAPYALLALMPVPTTWKTQRGYRYTLCTLYVVAIVVGIVTNLCDVAYFPYTGRRTTATIFSEFSNEGNLLKIFLTEMVRHWYVVLAGALMIWATWKIYRPVKAFIWERTSRIKSAAGSFIILALYIPLSIAGMRGGWTTAVRPITISNAFQYADTPTQAAAVLNTPFSMIRTWGKAVFRDPGYYTQEELDAIYSPVHPKSDREPTRQNVVVMICESMGQEYFGFYNDYEGQTPFLDSLCSASLTFRENYANGRKSIDGMPSVLSSIPMMGEPFLLTPAAMNRVGGLARELAWEGYETAFFHGAENGSMGFEAFARNSGFERYYGRTEFDGDKRFRGEDEFDGMWAIWDEPFLQFMALQLTDISEGGKKPFVAAVFTASSHHPYHIPEAYRERFPEDPTNSMHHCMRYLDWSLRQFFETARKQPWYENTVFVLTGDHTNATSHEEYQTPWGLFRVPVIFYDPSGRAFQAERREGPVQQIDIMPTVLSAVGHQREYIAFGQDVLTTPDSLLWAVTWQGSLQMTGGSERLKRAIEQSYMQRMIGDSLVVNGYRLKVIDKG